MYDDVAATENDMRLLKNLPYDSAVSLVVCIHHAILLSNNKIYK
jgi:hypothetical protein